MEALAERLKVAGRLARVVNPGARNVKNVDAAAVDDSVPPVRLSDWVHSTLASLLVAP